MKKIFQKFKNHKYRNLICVLGLVLVFIVLPHRAFAGALDVLGLTGLINWMFFRIGELFGILVTLLIGFLMRVAAYNDFTTSEAVRLGWGLMRDVCNMFFIVILMIIAVCTIIRVEAYNYKKMLPTLLVKAVLINFSLMFCGLLIDVSQVITLSFVSAFSVAGTGNFITGLGLDNVYKIATSKTPQDATTTLLYGMILLAIATVVIAALVFVFLGRIIAFWILIVLSPFTFLASASGGMGSKYADQWWSEFTKYLIVGPVLAFFLWLSLSVMKQSSLGVVSKTMSTGLPSVTFSDAGQPDNFVAFCISIAMLLGSLVAAQQIGTVGSGAAGKTLGGIKKTAVWAAKAVPGYANERFAGRYGVTLNPMDYYNSWKTAREEKAKKRLLPARSHLDDIAHYGVTNFGRNILRKGWSGTMGDVEKLADERRAQKRDEYLLEYGGEKNAAGKKRLKELKANKDDVDSNIRTNKEAADAFLRNTAEEEKQMARQGKLKGRTGVWLDKDGKEVDRAKWKRKHDEEYKKYGVNQKKLEGKRGYLETQIVAANSPVGLKNLTEQVVREEEKAQAIKLREAENVEGGKIDINETNTILSEVVSELKELKAKKLGDLSDTDKQRMATLKIKEADLNQYKDSIIKGTPLGAITNKELITKYSAADLKDKKNKEVIEKEVKSLKKEAEAHGDKADVIRETADASYIPFNLEEKQKEMAERKKKIERMDEKMLKMSGPDKFYRASAERALVAEEQKKIADVKDASELVSLLKKATKENDFYKVSGLLKQLASNGDDNEALNGFGYASNYQGMKDFFSREIVGNMKIDEQRALALANDIAYINEGKNHWETARVAKNEGGEWRWNTEREHTQAALGELLKKNDRELAQKLNRLAFGGEKEDENGKRTFQFSNLGKALMYNCGESFQKLFMERKEGTSNLIMNIKGDRSFMDELHRNSAITDEFYKFIYRPGGPRKPADWYDYVTRTGK